MVENGGQFWQLAWPGVDVYEPTPQGVQSPPRPTDPGAHASQSASTLHVSPSGHIVPGRQTVSEQNVLPMIGIAGCRHTRHSPNVE